jgi:hypothetical protein
MSLLNSIGRSATRAGSSKKALIGVGVAAGAIGLGQSTVGAAVDAGNDIAFGDPDADKYFLGSRGLSPGTLLEGTLGSSGAAATGTIAGGALGMAGGAALGIGTAGMLRNTEFAKDINIPKNFADDIPLMGGKKVPLLGGQNLFKAGKMGSARGRAVAFGLGAVGAIAGGAYGASTYTRSQVNRNSDFYKQSPYSRGSATQAASTNAYGDMVLGMHNARRG